MSKLWSRCQQCRKCEWNHLIVKNGSCCSGCGAPVTLYKRQSPAGRHVHVEDETRGDEGKPGGKGDGCQQDGRRPRSHPKKGRRHGTQGAASDTSAIHLLEQAAQATADAALQAALMAQIEQIRSKAEADSEASVSQAEAPRRADGAWKTAEHHHNQCVENPRCLLLPALRNRGTSGCRPWREASRRPVGPQRLAGCAPRRVTRGSAPVPAAGCRRRARGPCRAALPERAVRRRLPGRRPRRGRAAP
ncbi:unnamed protein product, partial [Prorocentrum cordatum]